MSEYRPGYLALRSVEAWDRGSVDVQRFVWLGVCLVGAWPT